MKMLINSLICKFLILNLFILSRLLDDALVDTETIQVYKKHMDDSVVPLEELSLSFDLIDLV